MGAATTIRFAGHGGDEIGGLFVASERGSADRGGAERGGAERGSADRGGGERGPAVVLVQEVFGLDAHVRSIAERLASEGFTVLAPDLYSREGRSPGPQPSAEDPDPAWSGEEIRAAVASLPDRRVLGDLEGALARLATEPGVDGKRLGAVGMCMGGNYAYMLGCTSRRVSAVVDFYGRFVYRELSAQKPMQPLELALNLSCPMLAIFGGKDPSISAADVERFERVMAQFTRDVEVVVFPEAGHGFLNDRRKSYDADAAGEAWKLAIGFLREHLGVAPPRPPNG